MPRSWTLIVEPHPALSGEPYPVRIIKIRKSAKHTIVVTLEHTSPEQAGRSHDLSLPIPLRPGTLTSKLFAACGLETKPGATVEPRLAVGREIMARFAATADSDVYVAVDFHAIEKEE